MLGVVARAPSGSIFGPVPAPGSWGAALPLNGNVGIGGDPERLRRIGDLLRFDGEILAEADRPGIGAGVQELQLEYRGTVSAPFQWARAGLGAIRTYANRAGFEVRACWRADGRWFAQLRR